MMQSCCQWVPLTMLRLEICFLVGGCFHVFPWPWPLPHASVCTPCCGWPLLPLLQLRTHPEKKECARPPLPTCPLAPSPPLQAVVDAAAAADVPGAGSAKRPLARTSCVALAPTGRCWVAASTEGLVLYSLGDDLVRGMGASVRARVCVYVCV